MSAGILVLALTFLTVDSMYRLRTIGAVSTLDIGTAPAPERDPDSPSGYAYGQHRLVLPTAGTDGYHWLLQTERMLAGDGLRIRRTDVDNAPHGREVHWSSLPRWGLGAIAVVRSWMRPGLRPSQALEQVAAFAGPLALALFLMAFVPLVAIRFGTAAAAVFALAWVGAFPLYESVMAGIVDHHGLVLMSCAVLLTLLLGGGGGWVRTEAANGRPSRHWLPGPRAARRWFIGAGVAGGIGLWLSAMTLIPVIIAISMAAVLGTGLLARAGTDISTEGAASGAPSRPASTLDVASYRPEPELWRVWGMAGCLTSLAAWFVEYLPGHPGWRLEVNHPLYALAWLGAGDAIARTCRWLADARSGAGQPPAGSARQWRWLAFDAVLIIAAPLVILVTGEATFHLADPFLRTLHYASIAEFQGLAAHLAPASLIHVIQSTAALPLLLLPIAALLGRGAGRGKDGLACRLTAAAMAVGGAAFIHVAVLPTVRRTLAATGLLPVDAAAADLLAHGATFVIDALVVMLLLAWPARARVRVPQPQERALLLTAAVPATALLALTMWQVRWLGTAAVALLVLCFAAAIVLRNSPRPHRVFATALLAFMLVPFPAATVLFPWRLGYPAASEAPQLVARDIAHLIRAGLGSSPGVIATAPTTTTWLIYFGGFQGIGTLYWENADGLRAAAAIFAAPTAEEARSLIDRHGVTHVVLPAWEPVPFDSGPAAAGYLTNLPATHVPEWLAPMPYKAPLDPPARASARVYTVLRATAN